MENERNQKHRKMQNNGYLDGLQAEDEKIIEEDFREGFRVGVWNWRFLDIRILRCLG